MKYFYGVIKLFRSDGVGYIKVDNLEHSILIGDNYIESSALVKGDRVRFNTIEMLGKVVAINVSKVAIDY